MNYRLFVAIMLSVIMSYHLNEMIDAPLWIQPFLFLGFYMAMDIRFRKSIYDAIYGSEKKALYEEYEKMQSHSPHKAFDAAEKALNSKDETSATYTPPKVDDEKKSHCNHPTDIPLDPEDVK